MCRHSWEAVPDKDPTAPIVQFYDQPHASAKLLFAVRPNLRMSSTLNILAI